MEGPTQPDMTQSSWVEDQEEEDYGSEFLAEPSGSGSENQGSFLPTPWIIAIIAVGIAYLYHRYSANNNSHQHSSAPKVSAEDARRKRLERLERQQQEHSQKDDRKSADETSTEGRPKPKTSEKKSSAPEKMKPAKKTKSEPALPTPTATPPPKLEPRVEKAKTNDRKREEVLSEPPAENAREPPEVNASEANATVDPPTENSSEANAMSEALTSEKAKKKNAGLASKSPSEVLAKALSSITELSVSFVGESSAPPRKPAAMELHWQPDKGQPMSWEDAIALASEQPSAWLPFREPLFATAVKSSYAPTKISDGVLWKASDWYHKGRRWAAENKFMTVEGVGASLRAVLDQFCIWVVKDLVVQLRKDIAEHMARQRNNSSLSDDEDEDDDLGLFEDELYGGGDAHVGSVANQIQTQPATDEKTLFNEIFSLLQHASCVSVLSKPFLAHLMEVYDDKDSLGLILMTECVGRLPAPERTKALEWDTSQRDITALVNLLTLSPDSTRRVLADTLIPPEPPSEGKGWEECCAMRALWHLAAFTVPCFSGERADPTNFRGQHRRRQAAESELLPRAFHESLCAGIGREYPVCLYARGYDKALTSYHKAVKEARSVMKAARMAGAIVIKRMAAAKRDVANEENKKSPGFFRWIQAILITNEPLVDMLESDLLSPDSAQALCSSRPFLLGITVSLMQMCTTTLSNNLYFDSRYIQKEGPQEKEKMNGLVVPNTERCLVDLQRTNTPVDEGPPARFSGATEFFFLTAGLLRISLFPGFRVGEEFQTMFRNVFASISHLATQRPSQEQLQAISDDAIGRFQRCSSVVEGWRAFVDDPDASALITSFSLLQLKWVAEISASVKNENGAREHSDDLARIPEWFVKLPAQWLAHVAFHTPHLLSRQDGEAAISYLTSILQAGTIKTEAERSAFSPPVLCQLMRVAGSFVNEGVRRARTRELGKGHHRGLRSFTDDTASPEYDDFENDLVDDRTLDIYHSFESSDLGVTVFTNEFVATRLCQTLMRAYTAMDAVEGMDVEREHRFEKFQVKHEVADLLLWLWRHPNGQTRASIVDNLHVVALGEFCSSVAGSLCFQLDQSCQFILDIRDIRSQNERQFGRGPLEEPLPLSPQDEASVDHHAKFISFSLFQCRRLLLILCDFSREQGIASILGGSPSKVSTGARSVASDMGAMFVNLVDRLTDEDGGIHPELEMRQLSAGERSSEALHSFDQLPTKQQKEWLRYFIYSRRFALLEYGLDVSILIHQLLALAACWHKASAVLGRDGKRTSKFLEAVAANDRCNIKQLENVFRRLCGPFEEMLGRELDNAVHILEHDGHVDMTAWKDAYKVVGSGPDKGRSRRKSAKQDRMSHDEIGNVAELSDVASFLHDLKHALANKPATILAARWGEQALVKLEHALFTHGEHWKDEMYTEHLQEWVVSSESFLSDAGDGSFAHSFDSVIRGRAVGGMGAGKLLQREARKCKRLIPPPHPNTSIFVCFAEERMDLCKAIISGASDTPFSLGLFEFDILFPSNYPFSPPLMNFRTTGDGQTRISSNLYNDGKVCISILGTYQAFDDSQRWNPTSSSLAQVLASIQTQLLGDVEPFFSDGFNHDSQRGTAAGAVGSERFNNKVRLHTLWHAMIAQLKHPPLGLEEVTKRHFALCRKRVIVQARRWTMEAKGTPLFKGFVKAYEELLTLLSDPKIVNYQLPAASGGVGVGDCCGCVPLNNADYDALETCDQQFIQLHHTTLGGLLHCDKPQAERGPPSNSNEDSGSLLQMEQQTALENPGYNPWATSSAGASLSHDAYEGEGDDNDQAELLLAMNALLFAQTAAAEGAESSLNDHQPQEHEDDDDFDDMYA